MPRKLTKEEFIEKAREVHGDKYDYSRVEYKNNATKVCIICPLHGEFWQTPNGHINNKHGCPKCGGREKITTETFIERARIVHGNKYNYSKVEYVNNHTKVCIICSEHGEFWQTPNKHLLGQGCPICIGNKKMTTADFIKKAKEVHGEKYDYSKAEYIDSKTKVCIICQFHGEFWQKPSEHLNGHGCHKCAAKIIKEKETFTTEEFIKKAKEVHGSKYDYSKVVYINSQTKVCIICPIHGEFWQQPNNHLRGKGCPICNSSHLENQLINFFIKKKINFIFQKKFEWLGQQSLDFYIPKFNIAIECQGMQHFKQVKHFGGKEKLLKTIERDNKKLKLCQENGVELLYFSNLGINYPYKVFEDESKLLEEIKKRG